jgi:hypothetical protein
VGGGDCDHSSRRRSSEPIKLDLVTAIGDFAFGDCSGLVDLRLPDTLTAIGDYAFGDCSGLVYLRLPDTLTEIGGHAFLVGMATR